MRLSTVTVVALIGVVLGLVPAGRALGQEAAASPEQQLADRYAPIAALRKQSKSCDRDGEGYFPAPVEIVLGNPEIALKQRTGKHSASDTIVTMGPTAQDLAGKDDTYYLDFPGNPHRAGCTYETNFKRYAAERNARPTTYAHIVVDRERGQLVLQYWFWYYFNDWNNTHESDWEMVQLVFDATSAQEALSQEPAMVGYAQHGGGEIAEWGDDKLEVVDGHLVVRPGAGSHGTYYGAEYYIGWGEGGTGFGCDNTSSPANLTPLEAVVVPDNPDPNGPFGWLFFNGRWGERQASEWNGPKGPTSGKKWNDPIGAMATWRDSSLKIPASDTVGPNATGLFCNLTERGSRLVTALGNSPKLLVGTFLGIFAGLIALFVVKRQELGEAFRLYVAYYRAFLGIGLFTIPIGVAFNGFAILVSENPPMEWVINWFNDTGGARLTVAATVGIVQQAAMVLLVAPPTIWAVRDIRDGRKPEVGRSFRQAYRRLWPLALALVIVAVVTELLTLVVIGIPAAIWFGVRWWFFGQAIILDDAPSGTSGIRDSARAVRGRWWRALGDIVVFELFAILPGPLVGAILMLLGKATVEFANAFSSLVYALTVPISVIGLSVAYLRYRNRWVPAPSRAPAGVPVDGAETAPA